MDSSMTNGDLQSLGATLREAREQRALTFEEVETQTRIRVKFLQALESGDLSLLPSLAHARGFLRNYAQFLHLDANAIIAEFGALTGMAPPPVTTSTPAPEPPPSSAPPPPPGTVAPAFDQPPAPPPPEELTPYPLPSQARSRSTYITPAQRMGPAGPLGAPTPPPRPRAQTPPRGTTIPATPPRGVAVPATPPEPLQPERPQSPASRLLRSNVLTGVVLGIGMLAIVIWAITQLGSVKGSDIAPTSQAGLPNLAGSDVSTDVSSPPPDSTQTATPGAPGASSGPSIPLDRVLLNIVVTRRTWAQIVVDGKPVLTGQVEGGQVLQYQANTSIVLIVGDAEAFDVTYNGQPLGPLGKAGQVVQRIFTPSGQITPTPTTTVTPTETLVPTPTDRVTSTPTPKP